MKSNFLFPIIGILFFASSVVIGQADEDIDITTLLQFKVLGTSIDVMPDHIHIIVSNPRVQTERCLKNRRIFETNLPNTVKMYGTLVSFHKPSEYPKAVDNIELTNDAVGDVMYTFLLESEEEKVSFIEKYKLSTHITRLGKSGRKYKEYISEPGYYIALQTFCEDLGAYTSEEHCDEAKKLECKLVAGKRRYDMGQPVIVHVYLSNNTEKSVVCIVPTKDQMIFTHHADGSISSKEQSTFYAKPVSADQSVVEIKPHAEIRCASMEFGQEYFDKPGTWELKISYEYGYQGEEFGWTHEGILGSNVLSIIIDEPQR